MTKKTLITIALLLACVCIFACCSGESFRFEALEVEVMTGDLENNGGISVSYKGYTYFINGDIATYDFDNTFGNVKYGSICRIKTSYLSDDTFDGLEIGTSAYIEAAKDKIEVLAPKGFFSSNSASPQINGLYIFDDRLYYTTPSTTKDKNGKVLNTYLDIMSVALDGTNTQRLYTLDSNTYEFIYGKKGNDLCIAYVNADKVLCCVNLSASTPRVIEVAENIDRCVFDANAGLVALTQTEIVEKENQGTQVTKNFNKISTYRPGDTEISMVITGEHISSDASKDVSFTLSQVNETYIYFSVATSDPHGRQGLYRIGTSQTNVTFETVTSETNVSFRHINAEDILSSGVLDGNAGIVFYNDSEDYIQRFDIATRTTKNILYTRTAPTFVGLSDNKLFYTSTGLYYVPIDGAEQDSGIQISTTTNIVNWAGYDFYNGYVLMLASTENQPVVYVLRAKTVAANEDINEVFIGIEDDAE